MPRISVLLVDEAPLFRSGVSSLLRKLGLAVSTAKLTDVSEERAPKPNVILVDTVTYAEEPTQLEELVRTCAGIAPVLLLAKEDRIRHVVLGLRGGAVGFLQQTAKSRELQKAVAALAKGDTWCDRRLLRGIAKFLQAVPDFKYGRKLTGREKQILSFVATGQTNKEIACRLGLSEQSIKIHVSNLLRKTGAANRSVLVLFATASGDD